MLALCYQSTAHLQPNAPFLQQETLTAQSGSAKANPSTRARMPTLISPYCRPRSLQPGHSTALQAAGHVTAVLWTGKEKNYLRPPWVTPWYL